MLRKTLRAQVGGTIWDRPEGVIREQYASLRVLIPRMYALMLINSTFLGLATLHDVPLGLSVGVPAALSILTVLRAGTWLLRNLQDVDVTQMRRYVMGTIWVAAALSAGFGSWGLLLYNAAGPVRGTAIALYVFVASISCCYCLQALPIAGRFVLMFGAMPVTLRLLFSGDWYLAGIAITFVLVAAMILKTLSTSHSAFAELILSRLEMGILLDALQQSEEHYRHSVDLNPQIPWIGDACGGLSEISSRWTTLTGMDVADALGNGWLSAVHPEDLPGLVALWEIVARSRNGDDADARYRLRHHDGSFHWYRVRARPRLDANGSVVKWYGNLEDIEDQVAAERRLMASELRYRLVSEATNDVIWDLSLDSDRIEWSGAVEAMLGDDEALSGTSREWWMERLHPDERDEVLASLSIIKNSDSDQIVSEFRFRAADGAYRNVVARGRVLRDAAGIPIRLLGSLNDVTAQKRYEEELKWAAHHDFLTQMPNRTLFSERLDSALNDARDHSTSLGLIVIDLDGFKAINDSMGHPAGDAVLREVALRLKRQVPESATVARLGGDEFAIILPGLAEADSASTTAETIFRSMDAPFFYDGRRIVVNASAGLALAFRDGADLEELHKAADLALYAAKTDGKGKMRCFEPAMRNAAEGEKEMLLQARAALQEDRIVSFYQPKVCLRTGKLVGFEALLRWHHREYGLQPPAAIRAAFDDTQLAVSITNRILDRVLNDMINWRDTGCNFGRIAINGSPGDFRQGDFADRILERLHCAGLAPALLELELTESVFLGQSDDSVSKALETLSAAGVTIALDDFGTGYASLTHLKQFPVDTLKIDRSFVSRLGATETGDLAIVGAVIDLARNLGITTVAEGIESPAQATQLIMKGCDVGQGFLFGRAMAGPHLADAVSKWDAHAVLHRCLPGVRRCSIERTRAIS